MFTDIVGSTERAAELGDQRWRELLKGYYEVMGKKLGTFRGREVKSARDGLLATSTDPRAPFDARARREQKCASWDCRSKPVCTRANAESATTSPASPCISARECAQPPILVK
jgi:class 3 adenylate cyclase